MTKLLFCSLNTKYIHTNLALRYLKTYLAKKLPELPVSLKEFNINQNLLDILREIKEQEPETVLFSTYIWNIEYILKITTELKKLLPQTIIILGGPETSTKSVKILEQNSSIDMVIKGEGEESVHELFAQNSKNTKGVYSRHNGQIIFGGERPPLKELDQLPFPYSQDELAELKEKIIYYESSRGCPFSCAYCLSSLDNSVRYLSLERVKKDLHLFLKHKVKLVKFVDRTFNLDPRRTLEIWKYIVEKHNGLTTFHFEIAADLLTSAQLDFLKTVPENTIQFEIGIQSVEPATLKLIDRKSDLAKLSENFKRLGENIHTHLDLLVGLPGENLATIGKGIDLCLCLNPDHFQLGFLKILAGTKMEEIAKTKGYIYLEAPPYEVLATPSLSSTEIFRLKYLEKTIDLYYNSKKFKNILKCVFQHHAPFDFFQNFTEFLLKKEFFSAEHSTLTKFGLLNDFLVHSNTAKICFELLKYDFLLLGKHSHFPAWCKRNYLKKDHTAALSAYQKFQTPREAFGKTDLDTFSFDPKNFTQKETKILFVYGQNKTDTYTL